MGLQLRAEREIELSEPFFKILSVKRLCSKVRNLLIKIAPIEFYSVLTQTARHFVNGTLCTKDPLFCRKYKKALYILSDPSTTLKTKKLIIEQESTELVNKLGRTLFDQINRHD